MRRTITTKFLAAREFLFSNLTPWDDEYDQGPVVCVEHLCFIPCRRCMYRTPAAVPYSDDPKAVNIVRIHQGGEGEEE